MDCYKYLWLWNFNLWEIEDNKDWWLNIAVEQFNGFEILYNLNWYRVILLLVAHANNETENKLQSQKMNILWSIMEPLFIFNNAYVYDEILHNHIHISVKVTSHPASKINKKLSDILL